MQSAIIEGEVVSDVSNKMYTINPLDLNEWEGKEEELDDAFEE